MGVEPKKHPRNPDASASEFLENLEDMFIRYG